MSNSNNISRAPQDAATEITVAWIERYGGSLKAKDVKEFFATVHEGIRKAMYPGSQ